MVSSISEIHECMYFKYVHVAYNTTNSILQAAMDTYKVMNYENKLLRNIPNMR